ncbi:MAG: F0F1 ATP synthase subunit B [Elusimicrobia bacterium]|nr:F0F1 ATP synthase subunit B [Candidatus Liberimonas magnetica]
MIDINFSLLLVQIVTFLVALFIVWKIAWGPLTRMMEKRSGDIKADIETAQQERLAAEELRKSYENQIKQSKLETRKIISDSIEEGNAQRNKIIEYAHDESKNIILNAKRELENEKERLKKELQNDVTKLAVEISEKLILKSIDKTTQDRVFEDILGKVGENDKENLQ